MDGDAFLHSRSVVVAIVLPWGLFCHAAQVVVVDPQLASSLPREATASSALATLFHCVESYSSPKGNADSRALAAEGFLEAVLGLRHAKLSGSTPVSLPVRASFAKASLYASAALACGTGGASRGVALSISGPYSMSYSQAVASVGRSVLSATVDALEDAEEDSDDMHPGARRFAELHALFAASEKCGLGSDVGALVRDSLAAFDAACPDAPPRTLLEDVAGLIT